MSAPPLSRMIRLHAGSVYDRTMSDLSTNCRGVEGAPNEAALLRLMERTGYAMIQENGQRKYGGPPPGWEGSPPIKGCEIFVGKIPRDIFEDELVPIFEKIGRIYEMRLMMDFSGSNRGYAFVMYTNRSDALRAVKELNNYRIREDRYLGVCMSVDNCRLFVGGIPKSVCKEEILQEMKKVTDGVVDVIVYPSAADKTKNRGFAFVEYSSHRAAAMARRKLIPGKIQLFNHQIAVDWAEPEREVEDSVMEKVRILYMRNLMLHTTEETIEKTCNLILGVPNGVERVKKIRDYAFVHFRTREDALKVRDRLNGPTTVDGAYIEASLAKPVERHDPLKHLCVDEEQNPVMDGVGIEVTLAKPVDRNEYHRYSRNMGGGRNFLQAPAFALAQMPAYAMPPAYYNMARPAPPVAATASDPNLAQPNFRMPMGRGGSPPRGRGRGAGGTRAGAGRGLYGNPGMKKKGPADALEEYCTKNGWGCPAYQLHSTVSRDHQTGEQVQLFLYKVTIPALVNSNPNPWTPTKLCRTPEEARFMAAEYVLQQLGVPFEDDSEPPAGPPMLPPMSPLAPPPLSPAGDYNMINPFPHMGDLALALPMLHHQRSMMDPTAILAPPPFSQQHVVMTQPY